MNSLYLTGLFCLLAGPLLAQSQLAERSDTTAAEPVLVPVPAAVLAACRQVAPEIVASPAAVWSTGDGDYSVAAPRALLVPGAVDTLHYALEAYFFTSGGDSTVNTLNFDREVPASSLPFRVRWALHTALRNYRFPPTIVLVVANLAPHAQRPSHRVRYAIWVHMPGDDFCSGVLVFWRDGTRRPAYRR